jgi:hypothetical protein
MNEIYKNNLPCWAPHGRLCATLLAAVGVSCCLFYLDDAKMMSTMHGMTAPSQFSLPLKIFLRKSWLRLAHFPYLYARSQPNTTWPFVTLNDFQQRADDIRLLSNSLLSVSSQWFWKRPSLAEYYLKNIGWLENLACTQTGTWVANRHVRYLHQNRRPDLPPV